MYRWITKLVIKGVENMNNDTTIIVSVLDDLEYFQFCLARGRVVEERMLAFNFDCAEDSHSFLKLL